MSLGGSMNRMLVVALSAFAVGVALVVGFGFEHLVELLWAPVVLTVGLEIILLVAGVLVRPDRRIPILCDPVVLFVVFQSQFFVVGPLALPFTSSYAQTPIAPSIVTATVFGFIALFTMFLVGYHTPLGVALADLLPAFDGRGVRLPGRWAEGFLIVTCVAACGLYVVKQHGIVAMIHQGYGAPAGSAVFIAPFLMLVLATFLLGWRVFGSPHPSRGALTVFTGVLAFEVLYWGFLLGTRKFLFYLFFGLTAIFVLRRGVRAIPRFVLPTVAALLICYLSVWGTVRGRPIATMFQNYSDPRYAELQSPYSGYFESVAGPFGTACLTLQLFPSVEPYRYGQTLLVGLFSPIPRAIWHNKPIGLGKELTWYLGSYYAASYDPSQGLSITPTLVGDFYANMGIFGVLLGGLLCGIGCRAVAAYAVREMKDGIQSKPARVLIPAVCLAGLVEIRGDAAAVIVFYLYTLIPLLVLLSFFSFERPGADEAFANPSTA